ncbi:MAG: MFS transporter [Deltaproteobacteria bacterium]|nr:MFS transporter [Deltaproteobacteria bacterium]
MPGPAPREESPAPGRWRVLALASALFVISQFHRVASAVVAADLQRDLGLSSEALGGVSAAFFYAFAVAQVPLALFLDRVGAHRSMTLLSLVGAAGAAVFSAAEGWAGATAGRVLLGVGMAGNLMGTLKLLGHWFTAREFGTVAGLVAGLGTLGNIAATTPLALLAGALGWRRAFLLSAVVTGVLALAFWLLVRERPGGAGPPQDEERLPLGRMAATLLGSRDYWLISFGAFCRYGSFVAIQGLWAGPWLVEVAGVTPLAAANLLLLLNLATAAGAPLGGWLSDRVLDSRRRVVLLALAGTAIAEALMALSGEGRSLPALALLLAVFGATASFGQVVYVHVREVMPPGMPGMAMTGVNFFVMLGAAAFLHGMGWVLDRGGAATRSPAGFRAAFLAAAVAVALSFLGYLATRERRADPAGR